jgi:Fic family protein
VRQYLQSKPILSVPIAAKDLGLSAPTVRKSVEHLVELGIAREATGKKRGKLFVYDGYLNILNEGTQPL